MSSTKVPAVVGAVLLVCAVILSFVAHGNGKAQQERAAKIVAKYKQLCDEALKAGDIKKAQKFAKMAIQADPNSKVAFACYNNALLATCPKAAPAAAAPAQPAAEQPAAAQQNAPAASEESEDDLGC